MAIELKDGDRVTIFDVAEWFLHKKSFTHKQLQKLCYYAQAWHCALLDRPLFDEDFQAWVHGPVAPALYAVYANYGWKKIAREKGESPKFAADSLEVLQAVYRTYSKFDGFQLEAMTHSETPWQQARGNLKPYETGTTIIPTEAMKNYYVEKYRQAQSD